MRFDFWNNPLVVSAFRRKYRRGGPSQTLMLYPLTLLTIGMAFAYLQTPLVPTPDLESAGAPTRR